MQINRDRARGWMRRNRWKVAAGLLVLAGTLWYWQRQRVSESIVATFEVRRGPLVINVLEGGSVEALESQEIRSEIKGYQGTKILSIVEEGYLVTDEDVKTGKVLVELDSSELKQRMVTQEIQFQSTIASLTEAQQSYEIQLNQNMSDLQAADLKVRFALMDLEKYLGSAVTQSILSQLNLDFRPPPSLLSNGVSQVELTPRPIQLAAVALRSSSPRASDASPAAPLRTRPAPREEESNRRPPGGPGPRPEPGLDPRSALEPPSREPSVYTNGVEALPSMTYTNRIAIDFSRYAKAELLGDGQAKQQLRKLEDDLLVARTELNLSQTKYEGTKRLREKDFVTQTELDNEKLAVDKNDLKVRTAETALALFIKYEFTKAAEEFLSKYDEALRSLERAQKEAVSKMAQAQAKLRSAEGRFRIEQTQKQELDEQLSKCVIQAKKPGLVVYGGGDDRRFFGGEEQIREGATVRERQPIITIPDMNQMGVRVKIHESHIKKVRKGLSARMRVDAFPDEPLTGEVLKVGVLPDSANRWMSPDLKVYMTVIKINQVYEWLKPGMSAKVEILVKELADVIYVPLQAVIVSEGKQFCYVLHGRSTEQREVQVGDFNDEFIEVRQGLAPGELVLLQLPEGATPPEEPAETDETVPPNGPPTPAPARPSTAGA